MKLRYDELHSNVAFSFKLRRYAKEVKVVRLIVRDTVELRIQALQEKKRAIVTAALGEVGRCRLTHADPGLTALGSSA